MPRQTSPKKRPVKRYRIVMTLVAVGVAVTIEARYATKDELRDKWAHAKVLFGTGKLATAEAWDDGKPELFKALPGGVELIHPPVVVDQPTTKRKPQEKPQTRKGVQRKCRSTR